MSDLWRYRCYGHSSLQSRWTVSRSTKSLNCIAFLQVIAKYNQFENCKWKISLYSGPHKGYCKWPGTRGIYDLPLESLRSRVGGERLAQKAPKETKCTSLFQKACVYNFVWVIVTLTANFSCLSFKKGVLAGVKLCASKRRLRSFFKLNEP